MKIHKIEIKGFKSISDLEIDDALPFMALAGPNGSGKSNFTDALAFLGTVISKGANQAIRDFGGFGQIHCYKYRKENRTTIKFRIVVELDEVTYDYSLKLTNIDKSPVMQEELKLDDVIYIDRKKDNKVNVRLDPEEDMRTLPPSFAGEKTALLLFSHFPIYNYLQNIKVFRIDPISAKEPDLASADASELDSHGKNIATMLSMMEGNSDFRNEIMEWIELIVPGMENLKTEKQRLDGTTVITFKEEGTKARFPAKLISDGTIYTLGILTAILTRSQNLGITIIEEPERGIHPIAIGQIVTLMRENSTIEHPIIITTHSESVIRNCKKEDLWLINKDDGRTKIKSALETDIELGEMPLDKAWLTNIFDGGLPW